MLMTKQTVSIAQIMAAIAKTYRAVTPVVLCAVFGHNDGGKLLRRHLRAHFTTPCNHTHGQNWIWATDDAQLRAVVEYAWNMWHVSDEWSKKFIVTKNGGDK
jgi:hypothetical protein